MASANHALHNRYWQRQPLRWQTLLVSNCCCVVGFCAGVELPPAGKPTGVQRLVLYSDDQGPQSREFYTGSRFVALCKVMSCNTLSVNPALEFQISQQLDSRCVLLSDPSTFGAGVPNQTCLESSNIYIYDVTPIVFNSDSPRQEIDKEDGSTRYHTYGPRTLSLEEHSTGSHKS